MTRYAIKRSIFGDFDTAVLTDSESKAEAVIALHGATLLAWRTPLKGQLVEVTDGFPTPDELAAGTGGRAILMAPWSNRLDQGSYEWDGHTHQVALTDETKRLALHGLIRDSLFSVQSEEADDDGAAVTLHSAALRPGAFDGYPFSVDVSVTFRLSAGELAVDVTARNVGEEDAPFGCGWHPYFRTGSAGIDHLRLTVPARRTVRPDDRLVPLPGEAAWAEVSSLPELDFRDGRPAQERALAGCCIDAAYADLEPDGDGICRTVLSDPANRVDLVVWQERGLMHVFTGDPLPTRPRGAVALEPVEFMTNAFNRDECREAIRLPAGAERTFRFGVQIRES